MLELEKMKAEEKVPEACLGQMQQIPSNSELLSAGADSGHRQNGEVIHVRIKTIQQGVVSPSKDHPHALAQSLDAREGCRKMQMGEERTETDRTRRVFRPAVAVGDTPFVLVSLGDSFCYNQPGYPVVEHANLQIRVQASAVLRGFVAPPSSSSYTPRAVSVGFALPSLYVSLQPFRLSFPSLLTTSHHPVCTKHNLTFKMIWSKILAPAALFGAAYAGKIPRAYGEPSANGFPNPSADQQVAIAKQAGGKLPNSPPASSLGDNTATAFQLIAFNELFETSFFTSLINNITSGVPGYEAPAGALNTIIAVQAVCFPHCLFSKRC